LIEQDSVLTLERRSGVWQSAFASPTMLDASKRLPEGLYTSLRTYHGCRILRPEAHAARLSEAGESVHETDIRQAVRVALQRKRHPDSRLRLTVASGRFFVSIEAFLPLPQSLYETGVDCLTVDLRREDPHEKKTAFISAAASAYQKLPPGIHEGLLVDPRGALLEGLSSNVFFVLGPSLRTAGEEVLPGVTRSVVLEVAARILEVRLEPILLADLGLVSEAFLTSVSRGILPVVSIDGRTIGDGRPGPRTRETIGAFDALVESESVEVL
jgi:branched-chain amino acid aminotransferase